MAASLSQGMQHPRRVHGPHPSILLALPYTAVTEEFLQLENKLSCSEEVTQKTQGQAGSFC